MKKVFMVLSSEALEFGGFNTKLVSQSDEFIAGICYWVKTTKQLEVGKVIELTMDNYNICTEQTKDGHDIRVIRPRV